MGNAGNDILDGGAGDDRLEGGVGNDTYRTSDGADVILTGGGTDTLEVVDGYTLSGALLNASDGSLTITVLDADANSHTVVIENHDVEPLATVRAGGVDYSLSVTLSGGVYSADSDLPTLVAGTSADDRIVGGADDDIIFGNAGDDTIDGGAGDDEIIGGSGSDTFDLSKVHQTPRLTLPPASAPVGKWVTILSIVSKTSCLDLAMIR